MGSFDPAGVVLTATRVRPHDTPRACLLDPMVDGEGMPRDIQVTECADPYATSARAAFAQWRWHAAPWAAEHPVRQWMILKPR